MYLNNAANDWTGGMLVEVAGAKINKGIRLSVHYASDAALGDDTLPADRTIQITNGNKEDWPTGVYYNNAGDLTNARTFDILTTKAGAVGASGAGRFIIDDDTLFTSSAAATEFGISGGGTTFIDVDDWQGAVDPVAVSNGSTVEIDGASGDGPFGGVRMTLYGGTLKVSETLTLDSEVYCNGDNTVNVSASKIFTLEGKYGIHGAGHGWDKTGDGTWIVGRDTGNTGNTYSVGIDNLHVQAGTVLIENASGSALAWHGVEVDDGATFGGDGSTQPGELAHADVKRSLVTVHSGGIIAPGMSIGTLTFDLTETIGQEDTTGTPFEVNEAATFESGAIFKFELGAAVATDLLVFLDDEDAGGTGDGTDGTDVVFNSNVINFTDLTAGSLDETTYTLMTFDRETVFTGTCVIGTGLGAYAGSYLTHTATVEGTSGGSIVLTVVPEPATMALLGLGGIGMLIRRKR